MRTTLRNATVVSVLSIALLCVWSIFIFNFNSNRARASSAVFSISSTIANPGSEAEVTFSLEQDSNICSFQLQFSYDETLLELVSANVSDEVKSAFVINTAVAGQITLNYSQVDNFRDKTDFVTLAFAVKEAKLGSTISLEVDNGYNNCAFTSVIGNTSEIENLTYKLGQITVGLIGDINQNNVIDSDDALAIQLHLAGNAIIDPELLPFADVNGDGMVRIDDSTRLQMFLLGKIDSLEPINYMEQINIAFANLYSLDSFKAIVAKTEIGSDKQESYLDMSYRSTSAGHDALINREGELLFMLHDQTAYYNNGSSYTIVPNFEKSNIINMLSYSSADSQRKLAAVLLSGINLQNCFTLSKSENGYIARAVTANIIDLVWSNYSKFVDKITADKPELIGITKDYFNFLNQIDLKISLQIDENIPDSVKINLFVPQYVYTQLGMDKPTSTYIFDIAITQNSVVSIEPPPSLPTVPTESKEEKEQKTISSFKSKLTTDAGSYSIEIEKNSSISIENSSIVNGVLLTLEETPLSSYEIIESASAARSLTQVKKSVVLWNFSPEKSIEIFGVERSVTVSINSKSGLSNSNSINVFLHQNNGVIGNFVINIIPLTLEQALLQAISTTAKLDTYKLLLPSGQEITVDKTTNYAKSTDMGSIIGLSNNTLYYTNLRLAKTRKTATLDDFLSLTYDIKNILADTVTDIEEVYRNENGFTAVRSNGRTSVFTTKNGKITKVETSQPRQSPSQTITISEEIGTLTTFLDKDYSAAVFIDATIDIDGTKTSHKVELYMPITDLATPTVIGKTFYGWSLYGTTPNFGSALNLTEKTTLTAVFYDTSDLNEQKDYLSNIKNFLDTTTHFAGIGSEFSTKSAITNSINYSSTNRLTDERSSFAIVTSNIEKGKHISYEIIQNNQHYYLDKIDDLTVRKNQDDCSHDFDILKFASTAIEQGALLGKYVNNYIISYGSYPKIIITAPNGTVTGLTIISNKSELGKDFTSTTSYPFIEYSASDHSSVVRPILEEFNWQQF